MRQQQTPAGPPSPPDPDAGTGPARSPDRKPRQAAAGLRLYELSRLNYAFQPIVNIHTGVCLGYEALLRGCEDLGFASIRAFFNEAQRSRILPSLDRQLQRKAFARFRRIPHASQVKLFFNLDPRVLRGGPPAGADAWPSEFPASLAGEADGAGLPPEALCIELTEHMRAEDTLNILTVLPLFRKRQLKLALDDFGTGFSGLQLLYQIEPDFVKIDRFFIRDIAVGSRKRVIAANMVNIAHALGVKVVAEGVETQREFFICRDIGCDLLQGYFVQRPTTEIADLKAVYEHVAAAAAVDRRAMNRSDREIISSQITDMEPISVDAPMVDVLEVFRRNKTHSFFPVVNRLFEPIGIIREIDLKDIVYSQYGRELLKNPAYPNTVSDFLTKCPAAEIHAKSERILDTFSRAETPEGVLIMEDMKYVGFLSAASLLKVLHEKKLALARDQNPLSSLPGNTLVYEYIQLAASNLEKGYAFAYLDFNHFKPFNDTYGFRAGDRAILLFTDLLKQEFLEPGHFIGHVGGDDFFVGFENSTVDSARERLQRLAARFRREVESFYSSEDRQRGFISTRDREGESHRFPLLDVSCALIIWPPLHADRSVEDLSRLIADLKNRAKESTGHLVVFTAGAPSSGPSA